MLNFSSFGDFVCTNFKQAFSINTQKKEYKCIFNAIYSSCVIEEFLKQNEGAKTYKYDIKHKQENLSELLFSLYKRMKAFKS